MMRRKVPLLMVLGLPVNSNLIDLLNGLQCVFCKIPVISLGPISLSLKLKS